MNAAAVAIGIGAPLGRRSYDPTPWLSPPRQPAVVDEGATLHLATGLLDERHRGVKPGSREHRRYLHAARWQDTWTEREHADWASCVLGDWPQSPRPRLIDALAFSIALAVHELSDHRRRSRAPTVPKGCMGSRGHYEDAAADLREFVDRWSASLVALPAMPGLSSCDYSLTALQKRKVLRRAGEMLSASRTNIRMLGGRDVRLPRVTTARDEFLPAFAETNGGFTVSTLTAAVESGGIVLPTSRAAASGAIVDTARDVVGDMIGDRDKERERVHASPPPRGSSAPSRARPRSRARRGGIPVE